MDPLQSINKVHSLVIQEENNNHYIDSFIDELVSLVNASDSRSKAQGRGRGYSTGPKPPRYCTFCGINNHTVDYYYAKHGHPNFYNQSSSVNASSSNDANEATPESCNDVASPSSSISQEKYDGCELATTSEYASFIIIISSC